MNAIVHVGDVVENEHQSVSQSNFRAFFLAPFSPLSWSLEQAYFEKGCRKKCTRQSRKVLWVVLSSLFFEDI